jgi:single-strand DNA-binding protein
VREGSGWQDGETSFFRVRAWREVAINVCESLGQGDRVVVVGRLRARSWETADGERRTAVEVEADEVGVSLKWAIARPQRARERATAG